MPDPLDVATSTPRSADPPSWLGSAVLVVAGYELVADFVNAELGEDKVPSLVRGFHRFRLRRVLARVFPEWVQVALLFGASAAIGAVAGSSSRPAVGPPGPPQP